MKKVFLSVFLALTVLCGLLGLAACGGTNGLIFSEYEYEETPGNYIVTGGVQFDKTRDDFSKVKEVVIPESYRDDNGVYHVTVILENAFKNCGSLEKVTIPKSIKKICSEAFIGTKLRQIKYEGTKVEWDNIQKEANWKVVSSTGLTPLICTDGSYKI